VGEKAQRPIKPLIQAAFSIVNPNNLKTAHIPHATTAIKKVNARNCVTIFLFNIFPPKQFYKLYNIEYFLTTIIFIQFLIV
jgi:uncharacterized protein (DUF608 family)